MDLWFREQQDSTFAVQNKRAAADTHKLEHDGQEYRRVSKVTQSLVRDAQREMLGCVSSTWRTVDDTAAEHVE